MTGAEVAHIVAYLEKAGIRIWLDGGWGVDALVGRETRAHSDLDAAVELVKTDAAIAALAPLGFRVERDDRPTRLVLAASDGNRVDFHPLVFFYGMGLTLFPVGTVFGLYLVWYRTSVGKVAATSALFAAFLIISGLQALFFAMWFDMDYNKHLK